MNIEKIQEPISSARFHNHHKELVDLDFLFRDTDKFFARYFLNLGVTPTFDFRDRVNKKLYTNEFIKVICEWIKNRECEYTLYFFYDDSQQDKFRQSLVKKVKTIFGFKIWIENGTLEQFIQKIEDNDCSSLTGLEVFFDEEKTIKNFKHIRNHLEKNGLTYLNDVYFEELSNKMLLFC